MLYLRGGGTFPLDVVYFIGVVLVCYCFLCKFLSEKYVQYLRLSTVAEYYAFSTLLRTPFIKYDSFFFFF